MGIDKKKLLFLGIMILFICFGCNGKKEDLQLDTSAERIVIYTYAVGQAVQQPSTEEELKKVQQYIADDIGVYPEIIIAPQGSEVEKLNTLLASGSQVDIFGGDWGQYYSKNVIIPINDLLDEFGQDVKAAWSQEAWDAVTDSDGTIWGIPRSTPTTPYPLFVRQDWLEACGLEQPTDIDSLENVLKVFIEKDLAGNKQSIGLLTSSVRDLSLSLSAGFTGVGYADRWLDPSDNKIKLMVYNQDYKDFIQRMAEWYSKGYIYKESFAKPPIRDLIKANKVGVNATWYSNMTFSLPTLQKNHPTANYQIAQIIGYKGTFSETPANSSRSATMITKMSKNPEIAMQYINYGYEDPYNFIVMKDGIESEHWNFIDEELMINEIIDPNKVNYRGELAYVPLGMATERFLNTNNPEQKIHYEYIRNNSLSFERTVKQDEFGLVYDADIIRKEIPMQTDISTIYEQNLVGFITGTRPISEWDDFLAELDDAGVKTYIDVYTREYHKIKETK